MAEQLSAKPQVCLSIGGSDSCGGAGIQADLRVFYDLNMQGCSAITALTAQNHHGITRIEPVSLAQLDAELHAIFDAYEVLAVKTGMLVDAEHIAIISACLDIYHANKALVVDPVMVSTSGSVLLQQGAVETLKQTLLKTATLVTPNIHEANILLGADISSDIGINARQLSEQLDASVLLKGGHGDNQNTCVDALSKQGDESILFSHARLDCNDMKLHGTGCRLASAVAAYLAQELELKQACEQGIAYHQSDLKR
jgi:hydroxymethylpyrimidine/phosphomethylpyrimidine kinase